MDIGAALIAHAETAKLVEPRQGALHHPAVTAQALTGVDALAGNAHPDVAARQRPAAARNVIGFVGMGFVRALAAAPVGLPDRGHGIEQFLEDGAVVAGGPRQPLRQRESAAFGQNVPFGARFAPIGGVGTGVLAPL